MHPGSPAPNRARVIKIPLYTPREAKINVNGVPTPMTGYREALVGDHGVAVTYLLLAAPEKIESVRPVVEQRVDSSLS